MRIDLLTLFPEMFSVVFGDSILKRAQDRGLVEIVITNIRDYATDKHRSVDDKPYGGGAGMVLMCGPIFAAVEDLRQRGEPADEIILLCPQGRRFDQQMACDLAGKKRIILIAGHYEGFDERIRQQLATREISIGDFVLTGGEVPAMVVVDAVTRLIPGVLGDDESIVEESFRNNLLEYPQYTRPADFRGWTVPDVLLSGNHERIRQWRLDQAHERTRLKRPDLYKENNEAE
jgi:tRNA (guanine37-N1)-methyltransferase